MRDGGKKVKTEGDEDRFRGSDKNWNSRTDAIHHRNRFLMTHNKRLKPKCFLQFDSSYRPEPSVSHISTHFSEAET